MVVVGGDSASGSASWMAHVNRRLTFMTTKSDKEAGEGLGCLFLLGILLVAIGGGVAYGAAGVMVAGLLLCALVMICVVAIAVKA
jgi:hypothetical protein